MNKTQLTDIFLYSFVWLARLFLWLLPYRAALWLGKYGGRFYHCFPSRAKHIATVNLTLCFPDLTDQEKIQLRRRNFESLGMALFETAMAWWLPDHRLRPLAHIHGLEHRQKALHAKEGRVIVLGAHFLTLEMAGRLFSFHHDFSVIYRNPKHPVLSRLLQIGRNPYYKKMIDRRKIRELVKSIREGLPLWYSPDIDPNKQDGIFVPFFNIPAYSLTATSRLAKLADAAVLFTSYTRRDDGTGYDLTIHPMLENFPSEDIEADTRRINQLIETLVREHPEQYLWQYRRFRTRPNGEKKFY